MIGQNVRLRQLDPTSRIVERVAADREFDEVRAVAEQLCLSMPLEFTADCAEYDPRRALVAKLGLVGMKAATDITYGQELPYMLDGGYINTDTPLRLPEQFGSHEQNPKVAAWAEQFGQALLEEYYEVLGEDADAQVEKFRAATSVEEQLTVLSWLDGRLRAICEAAAIDIDDGQTPWYHPIRISPKLMGGYPDIQVPPTCLGVSILAASFLEKTGAKTLHTTVALQAYESDLRCTAETAMLLAASAVRIAPDSAITDDVLYRPYAIQEFMSEYYTYHATSMVRLMNGRWAQIDPNFKLSGPLSTEKFSDEVEDAYELLDDLRDYAPLALTTIVNTGLQTSAMQLNERAWTLAPDSVSYTTAAYELFDYPESLLHRMSEFVADRVLALLDNDPRLMNALLCNEMTEPDIVLIYDWVEELIRVTYTKDEDLVDIVERCQVDQPYRQRRAADMAALVLVAYAAVMHRLANQERKPLREHAVVEAGLTAAHVAMSVLREVDVAADGTLSPGFWATEWPSAMAFAEKNPMTMTRAAQVAQCNLLGWMVAKRLTYPLDYDRLYGVIADCIDHEE